MTGVGFVVGVDGAMLEFPVQVSSGSWVYLDLFKGTGIAGQLR